MTSRPHDPVPDILLVDDDPATIRLLARVLAGVGGVRFAMSGAEAIAQARLATPDIVLLDAEMPGMNGFEVCRAFKAERKLAEVPIVFVTSHGEADFEVAGFEAGAADFIVKPFNASLVLARVKAQLRVKRMADELRLVSATDALTGLANRRRFDEALASEWRRGRRNGQPISLLLLDIDHFKTYNDRYGHPAGDTCLRTVAQALAGATQRATDLVARYGGEEFAVLLPETAREGAAHVAGVMLTAVARLDIAHAQSPTAAHVTASIGAASYDADSPAWTEPTPESRFATTQTLLRSATGASDLLRAADAALYAAKDAGRAQGFWLDVADADTPAVARPVAGPRDRSGPGGG